MVAGTEWSAANTRRIYGWALATHIKPRLGRIRRSDVTVDDDSRLMADMQAAGK